MATEWAQSERQPRANPAERSRPNVVRRMKVGAANDPAEREADAVTAEVVARLLCNPSRRGGTAEIVDEGGAPSAGGRSRRIQRRTAALGGPSTDGGPPPVMRSRIRPAAIGSAHLQGNTSGGPGGGRIQRAVHAPSIGAEGGELDDRAGSAIESARASGRPLDRELRHSMEDGFGADFSSVRIHHDADADALSRSVQATAFTTGRDIFFRSGAYQPSTTAGQELVAHELAHVVQQGGAPDVRRRFSGNLTGVDAFGATHALSEELYYPRRAEVDEADVQAMFDDEEVEYSSYAQLAAGLRLPSFDPELLSEHSAQTWTLKPGADLTTSAGTSSFSSEMPIKGTPAPQAPIRMLVIPKGTARYEDDPNWRSIPRVPAEDWEQVIVSEGPTYFRFRNGPDVERVKKGTIPFVVKTTARSRVTIQDESYAVDTSQINAPKGGTFEPVAGPLFPDGGPKPEHVQQTNLGDCYFQAAAASIAQTRPAALTKLMRDMQNGLVLVYLYKVDESGDQPTFEKLSVVIEKSVPKSATGEALYNKGELWVRLLEKAYARTGYSVAGANRPFRYEDIASGQGTFALRVLLGEAALHHTVASGPTLKDGQYFGLPVTTSVKGGVVSTTPTPLPVPWDNAMFAAFQEDPDIYHHDTFLQINRAGGPCHVQQQRHGVQRSEGRHATAGTVLYTGAGERYAPLPDDRSYRFVRAGIQLPGHPGEQFVELRMGANTRWAKPAEVTRVEVATLADGTALYSTLQPPTSTATTVGISPEQRVLATDVQVTTFGLFARGGQATAWWNFVRTGKLQALFGPQPGGGPRDVTIDDVRTCFETNQLDRTVAARVLQWITSTKLLPGKLGSSVYSEAQLQIHGGIQRALNAGKPVTAGTKTQLAAANQVQASQGHAGESKFKGLVSQHAYSVLRAPPPGDGGRLVLTVRNPWGSYGREYDWSKAPEEMAKAIEGGTGTFDIELSDFTKYFDSYAT